MAEDGDKGKRPPKPEGDDAGALRPTVLALPEGKPLRSAAAADTAPRPPPATVLDIKPRAKPKPAAKPAAPTAYGTGPTAVPGTERKRIAVEAADLKRLSPTAGGALLDRARRLVETFVAEGATDRQAVLWGHQLQQDYGDMVSHTLELSQADVLKRVSGYIGRMTDILGSIDIEAVAGAGLATGIVGSYLKKMNKRVDSPEELAAARTELDQLVRLMGDALETLLSFRDKLAQQARLIEAAGVDIEAAALAALFLSEHLRGAQPALSQRFAERSMSLTQTLAQIRGNSALRDVQIEQPLRLIGAIQNVALVMVPAWLGSIVALGAMLESKRRPTPTEARELTYQLQNIVQQLKA